MPDFAASSSSSAAMAAVSGASAVEGGKGSAERAAQLTLLSPKLSARLSAVPVSRASTAASPSGARSQAATHRAQSAASSNNSATARTSRGAKESAAALAARKKKKARIVEDGALVRRLVAHSRANEVEAARHICSMEGEPRLDFDAGAGEALVAAAESGHSAAISALLEYGANVNCLSGRPLQRACLAQQLATAQLLLSHAADPTAQSTLTLFTPLMLCCMSDAKRAQSIGSESAPSSSSPASLPLALALPAAAAPTVAPSSSIGQQASLSADSASTAAATSRTVACSILASLHSPTHTAAAGAANLAAASSSANPPVSATATAASGVQAAQSSDASAAATADVSPRLALLRLLLSYPSCCSSLSACCSSQYCGPYNGWQALHFAADCGDVCLVAALLHSGAEVDGRTSQLDTALTIAAERGHVSVVQALVQAGADLSVRRRGLCAVEWSVYRGQYALVEWLVAHGARARLDVRVSWLSGTLLETLQAELSEALMDAMQLSLFRGERRQRQRQQLRDELLVFHWHTDASGASTGGGLDAKAAAGKASVKCFLPAAAIDCIVDSID
ncbi:hypothetical protein MMC34_008519 [Xylographa carneopallida]|nr:hypothetical protein [Xylographa carneopallida]